MKTRKKTAMFCLGCWHSIDPVYNQEFDLDECDKCGDHSMPAPITKREAKTLIARLKKFVDAR